MKRYSIKEMQKMSGLAFAKDVLQTERNARDNAYSPVAQKLGESIEEISRMDETKLTYPMLKAIFKAWEAQTPRPSRHLTGCIVFKPETWPTEGYSYNSRCYAVSSDNKAFQPNMNGDSIFGSCMDGRDANVRLDQYMALEHGDPKYGWQVDYCILLGHRN